MMLWLLESTLFPKQDTARWLYMGKVLEVCASSGAAMALSRSSSTKDVLSLLICDRTFCNLEATAQRLVGECQEVLGVS